MKKSAALLLGSAFVSLTVSAQFSAGLEVALPDWEGVTTGIGASVGYEHEINENLQQSFRIAANQTHNQNHNGSPVVEVSRGERLQGQYQLDLKRDQHILSTLLEYEKEDFKQRAAASFFGETLQKP